MNFREREVFLRDVAKSGDVFREVYRRGLKWEEFEEIVRRSPAFDQKVRAAEDGIENPRRQCSVCGCWPSPVKPVDHVELRPTGEDGRLERWKFCDECWGVLCLQREGDVVKKSRSALVSRIYGSSDMSLLEV